MCDPSPAPTPVLADTLGPPRYRLRCRADDPGDPQSDEPATPAVPLPAGDPLDGDEVGHSVGANDELSPEQSDRQADDGSVEPATPLKVASPEELVDDEASTVNDSESTADA